MSVIVPKLVSLFLCDEVIHDRPSGKTHVLGIFDAIRPHSFPHEQARIGVFVALTGPPGNFTAWVQCLSPNGEVAFRTMPNKLKIPRKHSTRRVFFRILQAQFQQPGIYRMQFVCEDRVVTEQPLVVLSKQGNGDV